MRFNTFATTQSDIDQCAQANNLAEVLLEPALLARQGQLTLDQVWQLALAARQQNLRSILVWDALMPERLMAETCCYLTELFLSAFDAVRINDIGAAQWLRTHHPNQSLQLIVETGNHNLLALQGWCNFFAPALERLVLSIELPEEKLIDYCRRLPVNCEILGVGPILLFYSPRSLLAQHITPDNQAIPYLAATATPEETSLRPFPTVETQHGTLLFLDKDQFILDRLSSLRKAGLYTVRLDLRHLSRNNEAASGIVDLCHQLERDAAQLRTNWPRPTRAPFFKANKTTAQFDRMKAKRHHHRDDNTLAEIIAGERRRYVVFQTLRPFDTREAHSLVLPSGEILTWSQPPRFRNLNGEAIETAEAGQLLITSWLKKACTGALLKGIL